MEILEPLPKQDIYKKKLKNGNKVNLGIITMDKKVCIEKLDDTTYTAYSVCGDPSQEKVTIKTAGDVKIDVYLTGVMFRSKLNEKVSQMTFVSFYDGAWQIKYNPNEKFDFEVYKKGTAIYFRHADIYSSKPNHAFMSNVRKKSKGNADLKVNTKKEMLNHIKGVHKVIREEEFFVRL